MRKNLLSIALTCSLFSLFAQDLQLIVPLGHSRRVTSMAVSADHRWLATIDGSSQVKLWNYENGTEIYQLNAHDHAVNTIDFHPKKVILVSGSNDGTIRLWDEKGKLTSTIKAEQGSVNHVLFSTSGDSIFSAGAGKEIKVWNTNSGKLIGEINSSLEEINALSISKSNNLLTAGGNGAVSFINLGTSKVDQLLNISEYEIAHLTTTTNGNTTLVATDGGELISVDLRNFQTKKVTAFEVRNHQVATVGNQVYACGRDAKQNLKTFNLSDLSPASEQIPLEENQKSDAFRFGLHALLLSSDTTLLIADYQQRIREWNIKNQQWEQRTFAGKAAPVYDLALNHDQTQLAIGSGHDVIKLLDLTGTNTDQFIKSSTEGTRAVDFHPVNPVIAAYGADQQISVINVLSGENIFSLKAKGEYSSTPVTFDPSGKYILRKSSEKDFDFYDFKGNAPKNLRVKNGFDYAFTPDGRKLFFEIKDGLAIYDPIALKETAILSVPGIQHFSISASNQLATLLRDGQTVTFYGQDLRKTREVILSADAMADKIYWSPDEKMLIGIRNSQRKGENQGDFTIKLIDPKDGTLLAALPGHAGFVSSLTVVKGQYLLTSAPDGLVKLWDLSNTRDPHAGTIIPLDGTDYVVTTPKGHFDATAGAMNALHYVKNGEVIALDQLKEEYYEPHLLSKLLGYNKEPVKNVANMSSLELYPELSIRHPLKNDGKLGINLENNGGGIGRVIILINGKEVSNDVRAIGTQGGGSMEIDYDITDHPFLYSDRVNKVTVKAYNEDGTLSSDSKSIYLFGEEKNTEKPKLYAVIAGTSDYKGESLDLKYAAKDAADFANALSLSATKYLDAENVNITLLTTDMDTAQWPTKAHIHDAFTQYAKQATAKDLLVVYIAGHGVNHNGDQAEFYYLTSDADGNMATDEARALAGISSAEFTEYIKSVPALKQIMIIDACHSGRLASSLASSRSAMSATQIRSLERMKDRTGLFVLAGSAADAVSYETTLYGQGLLTYSLLFGMKGAALRDDEFIDVIQLFQFAANKVPELAEEIGGVQRPEVRIPADGNSFDIGRLSVEDREQIPLKAPKPVYVHSRFQDESDIFDRLKVGELLDHKLLEVSKEKDAAIVFVDDKSFSGASTIHGRYFESNGLIKAKVTVEQAGKIARTFEVEAVNAKVLADEVGKRVLEGGKVQ